MATERIAFDRKEVSRYLMYVLLGAACIGLLLYILYNAHPTAEPPVKDTGGHSRLVLPPAREVQSHSRNGLLA